MPTGGRRCRSRSRPTKAVISPPRIGTADGPFNVPFVTIESLALLDGDRIVLGNDNNVAFSRGRAFGRADDSEFIPLQVPGLAERPTEARRRPQRCQISRSIPSPSSG